MSFEECPECVEYTRRDYEGRSSRQYQYQYQYQCRCGTQHQHQHQHSLQHHDGLERHMLTATGRARGEEVYYTLPVTDLTENRHAGRGPWYTVQVPAHIRADDLIAQLTANHQRYKIMFEDPHQDYIELLPHMDVGEMLLHANKLLVQDREHEIPSYQLRLLH